MQKILFFFIEMCAIPVYAVCHTILDASHSQLNTHTIYVPDVAKAYIKWFTPYQSTLNDLTQGQYDRLTQAIHEEKEFAYALAQIVIAEQTVTKSTQSDTAQCQNRVNHAYNNALHTLTGEKKAQVLNQKKTRHKQWIKRVETEIQCFSSNNTVLGRRSFNEQTALNTLKHNLQCITDQLNAEQDTLGKEKKRLNAFRDKLDTLLQTIINDQKTSHNAWHDAYHQEKDSVNTMNQRPEPTLYLDYNSPAHIQELFNEANANEGVH